MGNQLSLEPNQTGLVLVVEGRENLEYSWEFQIDISKLQFVLQRLLSNNAGHV